MSELVHPNPERRWQNMRRMAWISLSSSLVYPFLALFPEGERLVSMSAAFYMFTGAVVGAYMGFSTWGDKA